MDGTGPTGQQRDDWSQEVTSRGTVRSRPGLPAVLAFGAALALVAVLVRPGGGGGGAPDAVTPTTAGVTEPLSGVSSLASPDNLRLTAVLSSSADERSLLLTFEPDGSMTTAPLPSITRAVFDRSGRWLAGIGPGPGSDGANRLLAGPVDGRLDVIDGGVRSFAWHDNRDAALAWTERASPGTVWTVDLTGRTGPLPLDVEEAGWVRGWGGWGFALQTSAFDFSSAIVNTDGQLVATALSGRYSGSLAGGRLLFSGSRSAPPVSVDPTTGTFREVEWLDREDHVWASAGPAGGSGVVLIGRGGVRADPFIGEVAVVNEGQREATLARVGAYTDVATSDDGAWIALAEQADTARGSGTALLLVHRRSGRIIRFDVPDVLRGREWVAGLALGRAG